MVRLRYPKRFKREMAVQNIIDIEAKVIPYHRLLLSHYHCGVVHIATLH